MHLETGAACIARYGSPCLQTWVIHCVIKRTGERYDFYECKHYKRPMTLEECEQEKEQISRMQGIKASGIGFVCTGGFTFGNEQGYALIGGNQLYQEL